MAGLRKGRTNNPAGRPKGSPNKITTELRTRINDFLSENWDIIEKDFKTLAPRERAMLFEKLLQYCVPRLQSTDIDLTETLTDEQIDQIIEKLKQDNIYGK